MVKIRAVWLGLVLFVGGVPFLGSGDLAEAEVALARSDYRAARAAYERELSRDPRSSAALLGLVRSWRGLGEHQKALEATERLLALSLKPEVAAAGHNLRGLSLVALAQNREDVLLAQAESQFRLALALDGKDAAAHLNLGGLLLRRGRDAEGLEHVKKSLELAPTGPSATEARALLAAPRRARDPLAPDFAFRSADGRMMSMHDLRGKVVLLDFWASWCGPCKQAAAALARLHTLFEREPVVMLGISNDEDGAKWEAFLREHPMRWPQYRDEQGTLARAYRVDSVPTYVIVDAFGYVKVKRTGWTSAQEAVLRDDVQGLLPAVKAKASTATTP